MKMFSAFGDRLLGLMLPSAAAAVTCWNTGQGCGAGKTRYCCSDGKCFCSPG